MDYEVISSKLIQFEKQYRSRWQIDLTRYENKLLELKSQKEQVFKSLSENIVSAPLSGTIINVNGIQKAGFVIAGQKLAEISPDSGGLLAECYVSPSDIGYIRFGNLTKFQIDAFHYNQWGCITGNVEKVGSDLEWVQGRPVFVIQCRLNEKVLRLKNGKEGKLKKGMILQAQFFLSRRSLWELLFDKIDDWLGPSQHKNT